MAVVGADGHGRAVAFRIAPGPAPDLPHAVPWLARLPGVPKGVIVVSDAFRQHVWDAGARPAIPTQRNEATVACPNWACNHRNVVERLWARLNEWRAVASRDEKTACSFMGVLALAAALDWIKT